MFKSIHRYFRSRFERFYFKSHWHFVLDFSLMIIIVCLLASIIGLYFYRPYLPGFGSSVHTPVDLNNPPLVLEFSPAEGAAILKDGTALKISFKNSGQVAVADLKISLESSDGNFSLKAVEKTGDGQGYAINGQTIIFSEIAAGTRGEAEVKAYFTAKGEGRAINWRARSTYSVGSQTLKHDFDLPALKVKAEIKVSDAAYYTSPQGDQLGIGPLPPLVSIPTNYWIFFEAQSAADWKNLVVSARLPKGVELTDSRSLLAGDFNYNPETRQLIWKVASLAGRPESYRIGFEIQLTPTADQVGQVLPLLSNPQYYATDALTGEEANGSLDKLTTDLDKDRFNAGQGKVVNE